MSELTSFREPIIFSGDFDGTLSSLFVTLYWVRLRVRGRGSARVRVRVLELSSVNSI